MATNNPILIEWRKDDNNNKYGVLIENEPHVITNGFFVLNEIPDSFYHVIVTDKPNMYEVKQDQSILNENTYKVFYDGSKKVFVHPSLESQLVHVTYHGLGIVLTPSSNIYDCETGLPVNTVDTVRTLQDYINSIKPYGYQGDYDNTTTYQADSMVSYDYTLYRCKQLSVGILPTNTTFWQPMISVKTESAYAQAQGDYAKTQGDRIILISEDFTPESITIDNDIAPLVQTELNSINSSLNDIVPKVNDKINISSLGASQSTDSGYGAITAGTNTFTTTNPRDFIVNQGIRIVGAGVAGADLVSVITAINGLVFTLRDNASTTVTHNLMTHDDTEPVQDAFDSGKTITGNGKVNVNAITDTYGARTADELQIIKNGILYNSYSDKGNRLIFGQEYLSAFHKKVAKNQAVKLVFSGDSTTAGSAITNTNYYVNNLISNMALQDGLQNVTTQNNGQGGKTCVDWINTYLSNDLSANPDLLVLRWGINDGSGNGLPITFINALRQGLTTIRASRPLNSLSIILMSPSSTYEQNGTRNDVWYESIIPAIKKIAREFQCCFIDTYAFLQDSVNADDWMDKPFADNSHFHPLEIMNVWVTDFMYDVIFPRMLRMLYSQNGYNKSYQNVIAFQNGFNTFASPFTQVGYWKDRNGLVHLRGTASPGATTIKGTVIFTLPDGFRPEGHMFFPVMSGDDLGGITIKADGTVSIDKFVATWIAFDGVVFNTPQTIVDYSIS